MAMSLPPAEEFVIIGYVADGEELELRLPWQVFQPDPVGVGAGGPGADDDATRACVGIDLAMELTNQARKVLFAQKAVELGAEARKLRSKKRKRKRKPTKKLQAFMAANSLFPETFQFREIDDDGGPVGYLRIRTFGDPGPDGFIPEVVRILGMLPQDRLIIDVRGNGGGIIMNGERMLQLFADGPIEAERLHFVNNELTLAIARSPIFGGFANAWERSIDLAETTGALYSQGFPIEPSDVTNAIGRVYPGRVALITDARCYSTTDIFAAGFQDNEIGPILGADGNTGAGGANVFTHDLLRDTLSGGSSSIKPLPKGAGMRVAIRQTTRVGKNHGLPLEDLGVVPDAIHRLTKADVLESNRDLIAAAIELLG